MRKRTHYLLTAGGLVLLAAGFQAGRHGLLLDRPALAGAQATNDRDRQADRDAIAKLSQEFREAFEKNDAKAIANFYAPQGEYYDDTNGEAFRGRADIEKAYAELFQARPGTRIDVRARSLRFLSSATAVL